MANLSQDISLFQYRLSICYTALESPHSILSTHIRKDLGKRTMFTSHWYYYFAHE